MKNYFYTGIFLLFISFSVSCLKDSETTVRRDLEGKGIALFWLSSATYTANNSYDFKITIYNSSGTVYLAEQTYSVICGGANFPGCGSTYGQVFFLPVGTYYATIVRNSSTQSSPFTVTEGGCIGFN